MPSRIPNLLHFLLFLALTFFSFVTVEAALLVFASGPILLKLQNQKLQLAAEALAYLVTLTVAWFAFHSIWSRPFLAGISWNWPAARMRLVFLGLALGFVSQAIDSLLPAPRHAPIEDLFRNPALIWFLAGFGTFVAPLFEEILFRGFLLPALAHAIDWLRLPRSLDALEAWRASSSFTRPALIVSSLLTSLLFALIHAPQIGYTWPAVALLAAVSLVLCWIRLRSASVAASTLVHACYNLSVFVTIFAGTSGFRHLERAT